MNNKRYVQLIECVLFTVFSKQLPESMTEEYKKKNIERMVKQGQEEMTGISSQYDFENKKWKGNKWW